VSRVVSLRDALHCAAVTAQEQPREVPEAPAGWLEETLRVLAVKDEDGIRGQAVAVSRAHSQYRAEFDVKGWLYDLRNALYEDKKAHPEQPAHQRQNQQPRPRPQ
jgi:hypothetical protein